MDPLAILLLATSVCTLLTAIIGVVMALWHRSAIHKVELSINGRLTELLAVTKKSSHAEGVIEGEKKP